MDQFTPVILFGAAAIAGHAWGETLLEKLGLRAVVNRAVARIGAWLDQR